LFIDEDAKTGDSGPADFERAITATGK